MICHSFFQFICHTSVVECMLCCSIDEKNIYQKHCSAAVSQGMKDDNSLLKSASIFYFSYIRWIICTRRRNLKPVYWVTHNADSRSYFSYMLTQWLSKVRTTKTRVFFLDHNCDMNIHLRTTRWPNREVLFLVRIVFNRIRIYICSEWINKWYGSLEYISKIFITEWLLYALTFLFSLSTSQIS